MTAQHAERLADSVKFWTDVKAQALAGGYDWLDRMVEELERSRDDLLGIESTVEIGSAVHNR